jgi:hypothetical protein
MTHTVRGLGLAATLVLISCVAAVPKSAAQSASTAAYVYVQIQGPAGAVYGYSASSAGQLSAISGSPFKPGTKIVGGTGSQFFTIGKTLLHSYAVGSNGAIGSQKSQIPFLDYSGSACGSSTGLSDAVLDHSGQYVYVLLENGGDGTCSAYQTYKINNDGSFTFDGDSQVTYASGGGTDKPSILGNETFAYADDFFGHVNGIIGFQRQSAGTLEFSGSLVPSFFNSENYGTGYPDASPVGNYVVLQVFPNTSNPPQLGSFTVGSNGTLSSTNAPSDMPVSQLQGPYSTFSPDSKYFVLYGGQFAPSTAGNGIEIYKFNGASPLTLYHKLLTGTPIDQVAWDSSNHLYAISKAANKLYVFTVTATGISQDGTYAIGSPFSLVVVSQSAGTSGSCPMPTSPGVIVCSPSPGATVSSPVQISATANVSGGVYRFELWNGNTKLLTVRDSGTMDQTISLAPGSYELTFVAYNTSGTHEYNTRNITVK